MAKTSIIFLIFLITACTPQISTTSTLIPPSITHQPTYTETIIPTSSFTLTPEPSETPTTIPTFTTEPTLTKEPVPEGPPDVWVEKNLTRTDFEKSGYIAYENTNGVIKGWYNTETQGLMSGGYSEWTPTNPHTGQPYTDINTGEVIKISVILTNDDQSFEDTHKLPHEVLEDKKENAARIFGRVFGVNYGVEAGNISRKDTQPASLDKKFQIVKEQTHEFFNSLANGTLDEEVLGTINMGGAHANVSKFDTVIVKMSCNPNASQSFSPGNLHWAKAGTNEQDQLVFSIDANPKQHRTQRQYFGSLFGFSVRSLVNDEVGSIKGLPADLSGVIILEACGKRDFSEVELPEWGNPGSIPFEYWGPENLEYEKCAISNQ